MLRALCCELPTSVLERDLPLEQQFLELSTHLVLPRRRICFLPMLARGAELLVARGEQVAQFALVPRHLELGDPTDELATENSNS